MAWFALAFYLARRNFFWTPNNPVVPTVQFGILVPIAVGLFALLRSARIVRLLDALPLSWLVGVQFYRVLGGVFLLLWSSGAMPWC